MNENEAAPESPTHERRDADVVSLTMVGGLLFACGALVILGCIGLLHLFELKDKGRQTRVASVTKTTADFPEPRLQATPAVDLAKLRAAEDKELKSYGWIDRPAGVVRIPIERAMELIAQRGLPEVGANRTPLQLMQERPQQGETPVPRTRAPH
jgi:hypothetical protein